MRTVKRLSALLIFIAIGSFYMMNTKTYKYHNNIVITHLLGPNYILRDNKITILKESEQLKQQDIIITGKKSSIVVEFGMESTLKIMPKSQVQITKLSTNKNNFENNIIFVKRGSIFINYNNPLDHTLDVQADKLNVAVTGTTFLVTHNDKTDESKVAVLEGQVNVMKTDRPENLTLHPGEAALVNNEERLDRPTDKSWAKRIQWEDGASNTNALPEVLKKIQHQKALHAKGKSILKLIGKGQAFIQKIMDKVPGQMSKLEKLIKQKSTGKRPKPNRLAKQIQDMKNKIKERNDYLEELINEE